jgi:hypothetical protein
MRWFAGQAVFVAQKSAVQVVEQQSVGLADVGYEELGHFQRYQHHQ